MSREDEEHHARVLTDLAVHAQDRTRKAVGLVTQLLDDDHADIAFVLMMVAADLVTGSAAHLYRSDEDMTPDAALGLALKGLLSTIGIKNVQAAIKATPEEK